MLTVTPDWTLSSRVAIATWGRDLPEEQIQQIRDEYIAARDLNRPLVELYVDWMMNMITLQWGESFATGEPVFSMVMHATAGTAVYVGPAMVFATVVGLVIGVVAALRPDSRLSTVLLGGSYLGLGLPHFWIGMIVLGLVGVSAGFRSLETTITPADLPLFYGTIVPSLLVGLALTAPIASYSRAYARQTVSGDIIKLVRAKGGGRLAVTRHVLRNASIPLVSIVFVETFALLALSIFVIEALFGIDGLGLLMYNALWERDLPVLLGSTLVVVSVGVLGNILQDIGYSLLDPRVDTGSR